MRGASVGDRNYRVHEYGTREWLESQYRRSSSDPWGLNWRPTQMYRYGQMIGELTAVRESRNALLDCVVDVGCATGEFTELLRRSLPESAVRRVVGVDVSQTAIDRAMRRHPEVEFRVAALDELSCHFLGSADLIACLEVLYYLPPQGRLSALEALHSALRPGGLLLVSSMIGKRPYMNQLELTALVQPRFHIVSAGCLPLWPLTAIEKIGLTFARFAPHASPDSFLPGRRGFNVMRRLATACRATLGDRANSHTYLLAERV